MWIPLDAAVFAHKHGLFAVVLLARGLRVIERAAGAERFVMRGERRRILLIIVHVVNIGDDMEVAARIDARARGVELLRHAVDHGQQAVELAAAFAVPRLVERAPADNGRVVEIAAHGVKPFAEEGFQCGRIAVIEAPVCHLAPGQIAEAVAVVEEARFKHLLVQARAVETGGQAQLDVAHKGGVVRRGVDAVRVKTLVQHKALEHRPAVEQHTAALDAHLAHAGVALHAVPAEGERKIIEIAPAHVPQVQLGEGKRHGGKAVLRAGACLAAGAALKRRLHREGARAAQLCLHKKSPLCNI